MFLLERFNRADGFFEKALLLFLLVGLVVQLLGLQFLPSNKLYHQLTQLFFLLPALIFLILNPRLVFCFNSAVLAFFLIFVAWSLLSVFLFSDQYGEIKKVAYVVLTVNAFLVFSVLYGRASWDVLAYIALLGGGFAWVAVVDFYFIQDKSFFKRVVGPGAIDHTILGSHLMGVLGVTLICLRRKLSSSFQGWVWCFLLLGYLVYMLLSKSKGTLLALFVCLVFIFWFYFGRRAFYFVGLMTVLVLGYIFYFPEYALRGGGSYRGEAWVSSVKIFLQDPIWGHGLNFKYKVEIASLADGLTHAHNFYLNLLIQLGLVGFVAWCALQLAVLRVAWANFSRVEGKALLSVLAFSYVALMTDGQGAWVKPNETWFTVWVPMFMALILSFNAQDTSSGCRGMISHVGVK